MRLNKFINENSSLISMNIYNKNYKDDDLKNACDIIIKNNFKSVSFIEKHSEFIWKTVEKKNMTTSFLLDFNGKKFSDEELFKKIKEICAIGVNIIEFVPRKNMDLDELKKNIGIIFKAKYKRVKLFIVIKSNLFDKVENASSLIKNIIFEESINGIRLGSGIADDYADSLMSNIVFDAINKCNRINFEIILCLKLFDDNTFIESKNSLRLAKYVLGDEWCMHCLTFSFDYDIFKNNIVNI